MKSLKEEKPSNCLHDVVFFVTFVFCIIVCSLSGLILYSVGHDGYPERWTCKWDNLTSDFAMNNTKCTGSTSENYNVRTYGSNELNLRWCCDLRSIPYPLKSWSCEGNVLKYMKLDPLTSIPATSDETRTKTAVETELTMEGPEQLIEKMCTAISTTPFVHKLMVSLFSVQLLWGLFLLLVSNCELCQLTVKYLKVCALYMLFLIVGNFFLYFNPLIVDAVDTALLVLMFLNSCVFLGILQNILDRYSTEGLMPTRV